MRRLLAERGGNIIALLIGSLPSLILSVAAVALLAPLEADLLLLGITTVGAIQSVMAGTYEATLVARIGTRLHDGSGVSMKSLARMSVFGLSVTALASTLLIPTVAWAYLELGDLQATAEELARLLWPLLLFPAVSCLASAWSAYLTVRGSLRVVFASTILRGGPTLLVLLFGGSLLALSLSYLLGELARAALLVGTSTRLHRLWDGDRPSYDSRSLRVVRDWMPQVASMSLNLVGAVIPQAFLTMAPTGSIAIYDTAQRILFGGNQAASSAIVLPSVARLPSTIGGVAEVDHKARFNRELTKVFLSTLGLALAAVVGIALFLIVDPSWVPERVAASLQWSLILLIGLPILATTAWLSRYLIYAGSAGKLPLISAVALISAIPCYAGFSAWLGGVGIVWGTATVLTVSFACTLTAAVREVTRGSAAVASRAR